MLELVNSECVCSSVRRLCCTVCVFIIHVTGSLCALPLRCCVHMCRTFVLHELYVDVVAPMYTASHPASSSHSLCILLRMV